MARSMLGNAKTFVLMNVVKSAYTESQQTDAEFAEASSKGEYVNVDEQYFPVTDGNVSGARKALGIESNYLARNMPARTAAAEVLTKLDAIDDKLNRLLRYFSEQARRDL